jgi:hypothetical protein
MCEIDLNGPAPSGGLTVPLSYNPSLLNVGGSHQISVVVPAGASSTRFSIPTAVVTSTTVASISATLDGVTVSGSVTLVQASVSLVLTPGRPRALAGSRSP